MKLNQLKNLGKELTKKELINVAGGDMEVGYICGNGQTGRLTGINGSTDWDGMIESACGGSGGTQTFRRPISPDDRYFN
ncbi:hypothetical protein ACQY1Q_00595 [Tenacibaculum sp. TC6]|uniref:hypothetical protein n=1 Tax=Tenacibaculum sp. TC6 TaxID=3423223 RepID=UPI003D368AD0